MIRIKVQHANREKLSTDCTSPLQHSLAKNLNGKNGKCRFCWTANHHLNTFFKMRDVHTLHDQMCWGPHCVAIAVWVDAAQSPLHWPIYEAQWPDPHRLPLMLLVSPDPEEKNVIWRWFYEMTKPFLLFKNLSGTVDYPKEHILKLLCIYNGYCS